MATVKRLSRVARECNVGIHTIVEFLAKKGFEIENNPNSKIPADALGLVMDAFQQDLTAKREAEKFTKEHRLESRSDAEPEEKESPVEEPEAEKVLLIADTNEQEETPAVKIKAQPVEQVKEKPKLEEKIEVEEKAPSKPIEEKPVLEKAPEPIQETVKEEPVPAIKEVIKEVVVPEPVESPKEVPPVTEPTKVQEKISTSEAKEPKEEQKEQKEEPKGVSPKIEATVKETIEPAETAETSETVKTSEIPARDKGPEIKVVGKIDIDTMNQKTPT